MSTALLRVGKEAVRRNPIKVSLYLLGVLVCLFFSGFAVSETQRGEYYAQLARVDAHRLAELRDGLDTSAELYRRHRGWFSCDARCQIFKEDFEAARDAYESARREEDAKLRHAKSKLGLFSEYGVDETRALFWERFAQGKNFAKRQTTWDLLFYGIGAMARDESFLEYALRVLLGLLFNFTLGMFGAVVAFVAGLYTVIQSYDASFVVGFVFFLSASLAAISFALSWLVGLYALAATGTFVALKVVASNLRIEGPAGHAPQRRMHYY